MQLSFLRKSENFSYSSLHHILESETCSFLANIKSKRQKIIKLQRIVGNFLDKLRKLYLSGTLI